MESLKEIKREIFCNIIHIFTIAFDKFNASLLKKALFIKPKKLIKPKHLNCSVFFFKGIVHPKMKILSSLTLK